MGHAVPAQASELGRLRRAPDSRPPAGARRTRSTRNQTHQPFTSKRISEGPVYNGLLLPTVPFSGPGDALDTLVLGVEIDIVTRSVRPVA